MKQFFKKLWLVREVTRAYRNLYRPAWHRVVGLERLRHEDPKNPQTRVLIVTGGGGYAAAKQIESLLAAALKLRGASVDILLCDGILPGCFQTTIDWDRDESKFAKQGTTKLNCSTCFSSAIKTYETLGLNVHQLSDLLSADELVSGDRLAADICVSEIPGFTRDGVNLGEHAMAGTLRFYATAELKDKESETVLRRYFTAALRAHAAAKKLFSDSDKRYDRLVLHHGIYVPQGIFSETAMSYGVDTVTWHVAYREKTFLFSRGGTYHKTMMTEPKESWGNFEFGDAERTKIEHYLRSRWGGTNDWISFSKNLEKSDSNRKSMGHIETSSTGDYEASILMLTNVMWDAQLHYPANAFASMLQWIIETAEYFEKRRTLQLIIRVHPAEVSGTLPSRQLVADELHRHFDGKMPDNIKLIGPHEPANTYELARRCDSAIIFGTKTGVELTAMGIPTIVAGEAWIRGKGLTVDVENADSYYQTLDQLPFGSRLNRDTVELAKKYAYHFFFRRMIPMQLVKRSGGHEVFNYAFTDIESLQPNNDPGLDVICDGILEKSEFIFDGEAADSARTPRREVS